MVVLWAWHCDIGARGLSCHCPPDAAESRRLWHYPEPVIERENGDLERMEAIASPHSPSAMSPGAERLAMSPRARSAWPFATGRLAGDFDP